MTESPGHPWESDEYLSRKPVQRGQATQWEVWCQIREKLRFVADQNRPSPGNRLEVVTFSVLILIIPWWIWHSFGRIESHFSLLMLTRFPWYIDILSFPVDCAEAFSMFDHWFHISLSVFCGFSIFMLHSYRPLGRSLSMSTLAVTFPCRFFFLGSGIHIAFPYLPLLHCRRFSVYHGGKSPTTRLFWVCSRQPW